MAGPRLKKQQGSGVELPILSQQSVKGAKQKTLDDYFPFWMRDIENWEAQNEIQDSLNRDQKLKAYIILKRTTERWKVRLH